MQNSKVHYWFIAPALILMFILLILPVLVAATLSMTDYSLGNSSFNWIGIETVSYTHLTLPTILLV